jgi:hypothetical protein
MPHPTHESPRITLRMICRAGIFGCCILLAGCSERSPLQASSPEPTSANPSQSLRHLSERAVEDRTLAEYKRYYERFRHSEDVQSALPIQQEATLARDYAVAREEFHSWLAALPMLLAAEAFAQAGGQSLGSIMPFMFRGCPNVGQSSRALYTFCYFQPF